MYLNKAIIIGNLTRDPEIKALPSGIQVTSFSIATNRVYKDKSGNKKEETDFHNIVVFGRQAETCGQYLKKGQNAMVEGRLQTRSWEKDGAKMYRTEIIADRVQFGARPGAAGSAPKGDISAAPTNNSVAEEQIEYPSDEINPEDIPF